VQLLLIENVRLTCIQSLQHALMLPFRYTTQHGPELLRLQLQEAYLLAPLREIKSATRSGEFSTLQSAL